MDKLIRRCTGKDGRIDKQMLHARGVLSDNHLFEAEEANPDPLGGSPLIEAKGFSAWGCLGDRPYWVAVLWGGELESQVEFRGWDSVWVAQNLDIHVGDEFDFMVHGPAYELRLDNPLSILTALGQLSSDFDWNGDKPPGFPRSRGGCVPLVDGDTTN